MGFSFFVLNYIAIIIIIKNKTSNNNLQPFLPSVRPCTASDRLNENPLKNWVAC